jgi:hypothetical protein
MLDETMVDQPKPRPVACNNCGAATDHYRKLCVYCESKLAKRPDPAVDAPRPSGRLRVGAEHMAILGIVGAWCGSRMPLVSQGRPRYRRMGR